MSHIKPMDIEGSKLTSDQHAQCAAQFEDMALAAFQEQHVAHEAPSRGV